jgi:hypothetical protein
MEVMAANQDREGKTWFVRDENLWAERIWCVPRRG